MTHHSTESVELLALDCDTAQRNFDKESEEAHLHYDCAAILRDLAAERDALRARLDEAEALGRTMLDLLDGLVKESGRGIDYGEEDPFRMGEWFEDSDFDEIERARAFLNGGGNG